MDLPYLKAEHYEMLVSIINDIVDELDFMEMVQNGNGKGNWIF